MIFFFFFLVFKEKWERWDFLRIVLGVFEYRRAQEIDSDEYKLGALINIGRGSAKQIGKIYLEGRNKESSES